MADPMEWFVDRIKQLAGFQKMMRGETEKSIMAIQAPAGMGKTWLIQRLRSECRANNLPTLHIDFRDRRPYDYLTIIRTARDQMGVAAFNSLTQTINEMTSVNIQLSGLPTGNTQVNIGGQQVSFANSQVSVGDVGNVIKDNNFYVQADSSTARRAVEIRITDAFFTCLAALATPDQKCVFLLDSYEDAPAEADRWLYDNLLTHLRDKLLPNTLAVLAGQKMPEFGDEWKPRLASTGLDTFSKDDVTDYLVNKRKVPTQSIGDAFNFSRGVPGMLSQMADNYLISIGATKEEEWL
jgi:hypothetical protein